MAESGTNDITPLTLTTITDEHLIPINLLCYRLNTNLIRGMVDKQAKQTLKNIGKNEFQQPKRKMSSELKALLRGDSSSKKDRFSKSEWKRIFGQQIPEEVRVIRDGVRKEIFGKHVVVGDLIELKKNNIVPADIRIICSNDLVVDNRLITGQPRENRTHRITNPQVDCLLSPNMIFACTKVLEGECVGVVLRTGENTVFGTLKNFATKVKVEKSRRKHSVE